MKRFRGEEAVREKVVENDDKRFYFSRPSSTPPLAALLPTRQNDAVCYTRDFPPNHHPPGLFGARCWDAEEPTEGSWRRLQRTRSLDDPCMHCGRGRDSATKDHGKSISMNVVADPGCDT